LKLSSICFNIKSTNCKSFSLVILLLLIVINFYRSIVPQKVPSYWDAQQYTVMAYNLYKYGAFSLSKDFDIHPDLTLQREPLYPFYLACWLRLNPKVTKDTTTNASLVIDNLILYLAYSQLILLIILSISTMYIVLLMTNNYLLGYIALGMVGFSPSLIRLSNLPHTEIMASLLLLWISIWLYKIHKQPSLRYFIYLSITLSFLVLTRAQSMFLVIIIILFFFYLSNYRFFSDRALIRKGLICFVAIYCLIVGTWILRNYLNFNHAIITSRAGMVLLLRSEKNMMTPKEFFASFLYWTFNGDLFKEPEEGKSFRKGTMFNCIENTRLALLSHLRLDLEVKPGGLFERFNRTNDRSFFNAAANLYNGVRNKYALSRDADLLTDLECQHIAINKIFNHPIRHFLVTLPMIWRGSFVESPYKNNSSSISQLIYISITIVSLSYLPVLLFLSLSSLKHHSFAILSFNISAVYFLSVNSFFTHDLARYNMPLIPIFVANFVIFCNLQRKE